MKKEQKLKTGQKQPNAVFKLTPMQEFALYFLKGKQQVNPPYLANEWHFFKTGRYGSGASRDSFGRTVAAYKCLRKLHEMGLVNKHIIGSSETYSSK